MQPINLVHSYVLENKRLLLKKFHGTTRSLLFSLPDHLDVGLGDAVLHNAALYTAASAVLQQV